MNVVNLTDRAAARISRINGDNPGKALRLSVKTSGCSGNKYDFTHGEAPGPHDERVEADGAVLFVDPKALLMVLGTTIDWKEDALGRQFTFDNPNEAGRCGCGESFHV